MNKLRFVEIYRGKDEQWKGFYNVFIDNGGPTHEQICIGLMEPVASKYLIEINTEIDALKAEVELLRADAKKLTAFHLCNHMTPDHHYGVGARKLIGSLEGIQ